MMYHKGSNAQLPDGYKFDHHSNHALKSLNILNNQNSKLLPKVAITKKGIDKNMYETIERVE
jgi:hypothetical protein